MPHCEEHGWYNHGSTAGCPEPVHHYPVPLARVPRFWQHDEERCEFCRALNEAKRHHYATLPGPTITVSP